MTNKFKLGDTVRLISKNNNSDNGFTIGEIVEIIGVGLSGIYPISIKNDNYIGYVNAEQLAKVNFTKHDLQNGDVITLRNGNKLIYIQNNNFVDLETSNRNEITDIDDFTPYHLNYSYCGINNTNYDIVKVERPRYNTLYEREEIKEMTIAQISEALGYGVKIIKEEK